MEVIVTSVYWPMLHEELYAVYIVEKPVWIYYLWTAHSIPLICLVIDFAISNFTFVFEHIKVVWAIAVIYTILSLISVFVYDQVIYSFMTFRDIKSYVILIGLIISITGFHGLVCNFSVWK